MKRKSSKNNNEVNMESRFTKVLFTQKSEKFTEEIEDTKRRKTDVEDIDRKPAWIDDDDVNFEANIIPNIKSKGLYVDKLKQKYQTLMGTPKWAKLEEKDKPDAGETLLSTVGHLQKKKRTGALNNEFLEIKNFPKINSQTRFEGHIINCIEFHPKSSVSLVAGDSGVVSLFSVGGRENEKLHSFKLKKWKISTSYFAPNGNEAYIWSWKQPSFCVYDLIKAEPQIIPLPKNIRRAKSFILSPNGEYIAICDKYDEVFILSTASKELLKVLKHNSNVASATFSHDSKQLYSYGCQGEITIWDLSTYRSVKKFYDNDCIKASCLATSPCGRLLATGSGEGIVNIYQTDNLNSAEPTPLKTISNLTTKITSLKFNPTTEILGMASFMYPNAVKMVHIPSYHVFKNFPPQEKNEQLGHVNVINFSPNSGYMGLGNNKGSACLFRLKHYKNY